MITKRKHAKHKVEYQCQACGATSSYPKECCGEFMGKIDPETDLFKAPEEE